MEAASTTSSTGASSSFATWAVEASSPRPEAPSKRPMTPSTTAMSAPVAAVAHERRHQLGPAQERVEIATRPARSERVVARIDVVGPDLEPLHHVPARPQRPDDAARDRRLPRPRARARNHDPRDHARRPPEVQRITIRCPAGRGCRHPSGASTSPPRTRGPRPRSARAGRRGRSGSRAGSRGGRAGSRSRRRARSSPT